MLKVVHLLDKVVNDFYFQLCSLLMIREVSAMLRVKGAMLFELSSKDEAICYAKLKEYFEQMYFGN